jgi:hypothetical protein
MRLIGLVVVLTLSLMMVLTTEAQQAGKVHRVGIVWARAS